MRPRDKDESSIQIGDLVAALQALSPNEERSPAGPRSSDPASPLPSSSQTLAMEERIATKLMAPLDLGEFNPRAHVEDLDLSSLIANAGRTVGIPSRASDPRGRVRAALSLKRIVTTLSAALILLTAAAVLGPRDPAGRSTSSGEPSVEVRLGGEEVPVEGTNQTTASRARPTQKSSKDQAEPRHDRSGLFVQGPAENPAPAPPTPAPDCETSAGEVCLHAPDLQIPIPSL